MVNSNYLEQRITFQVEGIRIAPRERLLDIKHTKRIIIKRTELAYVEKNNSLGDYVD